MRAIIGGIILAMLVLVTGAMAMDGKKGGTTSDGDYAWFSAQEVAELLIPSAFWCMEPEGQSCLFTVKSEGAIVSGPGAWFAYDVTEMWDEETRLVVPTQGQVKDDGSLCETVSLDYSGISAVGLDGIDVGKSELSEIQSELRELWGEDEGREFCYRYAIVNHEQPDLISQFLYIEGSAVDDPINFIVDHNSGNGDRYDLRFQ